MEKKSESDSFFGDYDSAIKPINRGKNRYSNVLPLEKTRVKLRPKNHAEGSDYINANWVDGLIPGSERAYITTQGPLQETVEDFWRMISETGSNVIVMLTKEVENDKIKCTHYWPLEPGNAFTFDTLRVTLVSEEKTFENRLVERTLELHHPDTGDRRVIKHYQYLDWPDHGLPESAAAFRKILHKVDRVRAEKSPIVVHCSAQYPGEAALTPQGKARRAPGVQRAADGAADEGTARGHGPDEGAIHLLLQGSPRGNAEAGPDVGDGRSSCVRVRALLRAAKAATVI